MIKKSKFKSAGKSELLEEFQSLDNELVCMGKKVDITILGGASLILLGLRDRATQDIDIANTSDANLFYNVCKKNGIAVDIITVASTVDLIHCATVHVFQGKALIVHSVTAKDLIKLKLERFRKQDPEDIYAIIEHESISFDDFKSLVTEMLHDYIGNENELKISAQVVVEQLFPEKIGEFNTETKTHKTD